MECSKATLIMQLIRQVSLGVYLRLCCVQKSVNQAEKQRLRTSQPLAHLRRLVKWSMRCL